MSRLLGPRAWRINRDVLTGQLHKMLSDIPRPVILLQWSSLRDG